MALGCLGSLLSHSAEPLRLRVHDDGSLSERDLDRLAAGLGSPEVLRRAEADARLSDFLVRYPALASFRRRSPLALKVIDAVLLAEDQRLFYCDTDVLFLRPFRGLFDFGSEACGAFFMSDVQNAYSVRSWHLVRHRRLKLPCRVNTGLFGYRAERYDPELAEWFASRPEFRFAPVWEEQTLWALLGFAAGASLLDPSQFQLPEEHYELSGELVALHFVSPRRSFLPQVQALAPDRRGELPVQVESRPATRCTPLALLATELSRRLGRR
jgi:hypothetical protein